MANIFINGVNTYLETSILLPIQAGLAQKGIDISTSDLKMFINLTNDVKQTKPIKAPKPLAPTDVRCSKIGFRSKEQCVRASIVGTNLCSICTAAEKRKANKPIANTTVTVPQGPIDIPPPMTA